MAQAAGKQTVCLRCPDLTDHFNVTYWPDSRFTIIDRERPKLLHSCPPLVARVGLELAGCPRCQPQQ